MSGKLDYNARMLIVMGLTVIAGVMVFFIFKWFLSFVANHWFGILVVVLAAIGFGLFRLFRKSASEPW